MGFQGVRCFESLQLSYHAHLLIYSVEFYHISIMKIRTSGEMFDCLVPAPPTNPKPQ